MQHCNTPPSNTVQHCNVAILLPPLLYTQSRVALIAHYFCTYFLPPTSTSTYYYYYYYFYYYYSTSTAALQLFVGSTRTEYKPFLAEMQMRAAV